MKEIKPMQVSRIESTQVEPGMIIAEGIVLRVRPQHGRRGGVEAVFYDLPNNHTVCGEPGQLVQVYARITDDMLEGAREAYLQPAT